ncbi:MAG: AmmeMemoRadiSam system protein A [Deltaproteobacteria bacterium]|nr:AmmeMemoRadiSam system protein A [Deltaproteobacteria bacterium]
MTSLRGEDKITLLKLARSVIKSAIDKNVKVIRPETATPELNNKKGCFVTLHKKGALRGCIGTIEPVKSLIAAVEDNALNAAFRDPRFPSLTVNELSDVDLEISVLSPPTVLEYQDHEDLKNKLKPGVHGVILSKDWRSATFLPQVWEQLPDIEVFLGHLCQKAGMADSCWMDKDIVIKVYEVEYFSEKDTTFH